MLFIFLTTSVIGFRVQSSWPGARAVLEPDVEDWFVRICHASQIQTCGAIAGCEAKFGCEIALIRNQFTAQSHINISNKWCTVVWWRVRVNLVRNMMMINKFRDLQGNPVNKYFFLGFLIREQREWTPPRKAKRKKARRLIGWILDLSCALSTFPTRMCPLSLLAFSLGILYSSASPPHPSLPCAPITSSPSSLYSSPNPTLFYSM